MYIYIYIYRERERCIHIPIDTYTYRYIDREREKGEKPGLLRQKLRPLDGQEALQHLLALRGGLRAANTNNNVT